MGALALQAPAPGDRLAVCVATLGMLRAEARRSPVLVVVDDVQWVDASSRECIEYVARRASGPLAVVLAAYGIRGTRRSASGCRICPSATVDDCAAAETPPAARPGAGAAGRGGDRAGRGGQTRWPWSNCPPR